MSRKIYIVDLASYNAGNTKGNWFDVESSAGFMWEAIKEFFGYKWDEDEGDEDDQDQPWSFFEWAIHDSEGYPDGFISEHHELDELAVLEGILEDSCYKERPSLVLYCAQEYDLDKDSPKQFKEIVDQCYGPYDNEEDYAVQLVEDCHNIKEMGWLGNYIDYEKMTNDFQIENHYLETDEGWYVIPPI